MIKIFGIKNCDTVKKARAWLDAAGVAYRFHDFRRDGLDGALVDEFIAALGWQALLNTRGTTWRKLVDEDKADMDAARARALMLAHDALIKRPVWRLEDGWALGFAAKDRDGLAARLGTE